MKNPVFIALGAAGIVCLGCGSAPGRYGSEARYSPAYRGYVVAHPDASVDETLFLIDPLTQKKIRCREQLEPWLRMYAEEEPTKIDDENLGLKSLLLMFPATAVAATAFDVAAPFAALAMTPYFIGKSESADTLFKNAMVSFRDEDYSAARIALENA